MLWQIILIIQTLVSQENSEDTDTRFTRKSRGFLQVLFLPKKTLGSKMLYRDISCHCYAI